jgi:hypothetical protein
MTDSAVRNRVTAPLALIERADVHEIWADGAIMLDDGEVIRIVHFSTRHRGDGTVDREIVSRIVMSATGFVWSLQGALALPSARPLTDVHGKSLVN